jgi:hypothetical protein
LNKGAGSSVALTYLVTTWGNAMKLYEFAPTRSIRVRWTLQELGIDFEAVPID